MTDAPVLPPIEAETVPDGRRDAPSIPVGVVAVLGVLTALFLLSSAPWLGARFGESHDGRNGSTWGAASRAVREEGPIASRFGGRTETGAYASHPPGIVAETAVAEVLAGEHRIVTRSPAWIGSIVAMVLLAWLLVDLGLSTTSVITALVVTFSSAMFLVYGSMLDTPVTSLPFALAVVIAGQRISDRRAPPLVLIFLVAVLATVSGWLAFVFAAAQVIRVAWSAWRGVGSWRPVAALAGGTVSGLVITVAYGWWVYGSFATMVAKLQDKTSAVGLGTSLIRQARDLEDLYLGAAIVGVVGAAVALVGLHDRRWRGALAMTALPVVAYAVVFRGGAQMHDYWNYAALVPLAVGAAGGAETVLGSVPAERRRMCAWGLGTAALLVAALGSSHLSDGEARLRNSLGTPALASRAADLVPGDGPAMAYLSPEDIESPWVPYELERPGLALHGRDALVWLAEREPDFPVLVPWVSFDDGGEVILDGAYAVEGPYALAPADVVATALEGE